MWVSAMEPTAQLLAAPFRPQPDGLVAAACPASGRVAGTLKGARFDTEASFRIEHGRCVGELAGAEPLRAFFANAYAWPGQRLRIVSLASDGSLSRAALATPYGLYDLRATGARRWSAAFNAEATLELAL
jgi:serine beta-lactamase-like protein LACTB